ncbi:hypothetical protein LZ32DRAFT_599659 [Colletotrichum eremochloae]|nr:hypothetical protein LZ32DRAFT_599659 [Colletotrichum eremochloae]
MKTHRCPYPLLVASLLSLLLSLLSATLQGWSQCGQAAESSTEKRWQAVSWS